MPSLPAGSDGPLLPVVEPESQSAGSSRHSARVLRVDRGDRRPASHSLTPELRALLERAVVDAADAWSAGAEHANGTGAYEALSILGNAVIQALAGETPDLSGWPTISPMREPVDRLRRALLNQMSSVSVRVRSDDILMALRALERVHEYSQRDTSRHFAEQLSSGNALDLVVGVAHDMRSPLSSILFLVESLRNLRRGTVTPVEERQLGLVYSAAHGLSQLVSDVIELARGCDRLLDRRPVPFSVSELLNGVCRVVQPIAEEKRLSLYLELPEVDARIGYPVALGRVMLNLVTNALKFTHEGYVEIASRQKSRGVVEFSVRDTGPGIPPHELATLYDALRQRAKTQGYFLSSSGLGLAICQKLVTAMGGELSVETTVGRETRFTFTLDLPPATKL